MTVVEVNPAHSPIRIPPLQTFYTNVCVHLWMETANAYGVAQKFIQNVL